MAATTIGGKIRNVVVGMIIGLLVIGFALWGVNDVFTPSNPNAVMSIGDNNVSINDFNDAFRNELRTMGQETGVGLSDADAYARGVHEKVLNQLRGEALISVDSDELGIGVNRKSARKVVEQIPSFKDELTGEFSEKKMEEVLASNRLSRKEFENDVFKSLRRQQTVPGILSGIDAPTEYGAMRYKFITEQRKARVLTIDERSVEAPADPEDDVLKTFIDKNVVRYTAPEYRRFTLLRLENFDVTPDMNITDQDIKDAYDYKLQLGEIGSAEVRSVVQITADDEATAKVAAERLTAGEDAAIVASSLGLIEPQVYEDVEADAITDPKSADAAFEMGQGEAKALVGSLGFWYALKVTNVTAAVAPDFETYKGEITADVEKAMAEEALYDITKIIEDGLDEGLTLEEVAELAKVPLSSIDFIDRRGMTRDGFTLSGLSFIPGVAQDDTILTELFVNDLSYTTDLFETATGGWATLRVDDIMDSQRRPFDEVKSSATAAWKTEQVNELLDEKMRELGDRARKGESLNAITESVQNGAAVDDVILVRSSPSDKLGPLVTVELLDAEIDEVVRGPGPKPLTRQIGKLTRIVANQDALAGRFEDVMRQQINSSISGDINQAYQNAILREHPLREYPEKVKSTLGITN